MALEYILLLNMAVLAAVSLLLWGVSMALRDVSIVDICWGLGYVLVAWLTFTLSGVDSASWSVLLLVTIVSLWGVRLASYLAWRNWGKPEDSRYAAMREKHGSKFPIVSLVTVFGLQGSLIWFISLPLQIGIVRDQAWPAAVGVGAILWLVGLLLESVGDFQLARFKSNPANQGQVLDRGLWRYTRHPNYFGDFLVWWGFYLVAAEPESWWYTISGPLLMSFLLLRVSGVRLLESSLRSRVDGYEEYVQRTSAFFPLPPKTSRSRGNQE